MYKLWSVNVHLQTATVEYDWLIFYCALWAFLWNHMARTSWDLMRWTALLCHSLKMLLLEVCLYTQWQDSYVTAVNDIVKYWIWFWNQVPNFYVQYFWGSSVRFMSSAEKHILILSFVPCLNNREFSTKWTASFWSLSQFTSTSLQILAWSKSWPGGEGNVGEREKRTVLWLLICIKIPSTPTLTFNEVKVDSNFQWAVEVGFGRQIRNKGYVVIF